MTDSLLSRRALMRYGAYGAGAAALAGVAAGWDRLTAADIPGRDDGSLVIATLGSAFNPEAQRALRDGFREVHPDIKIRINPVQAYDWSDFFAKILTLVGGGHAAGRLCTSPPRAPSCSPTGWRIRWTSSSARDRAELQEYFDDVHPSLIEAFMYQGSLFQLPFDFNAAEHLLQHRRAANAPACSGRPRRLDQGRLPRRAARDARRRTAAVPPVLLDQPPVGRRGAVAVRQRHQLPGRVQGPRRGVAVEQFYPDDPTSAQRGGGYRWLETQRRRPAAWRSRSSTCARWSPGGLGSSPAQGAAANWSARFAEGVIGMTPAGGFWVQGLNQGGHGRGRLRRDVLPAVAHAAAPVRRRRATRSCGRPKRKDEAWEWVKFCASKEAMQLAIPAQPDHADPALAWSTRPSTPARGPGTGRSSTTRSTASRPPARSRAAAAGRGRDRPDQERAGPPLTGPAGSVAPRAAHDAARPRDWPLRRT